MSRLMLLLFLLGSLASAFAEEPLLKAKVASVKEYKDGRISYWEGRTPIYDGRPFFDLTLIVGEKKYLVRYESETGYYPSAWKVGSEIQVKKQRGRFILMNRAEEVQARIVSESDCIEPTGPPTIWVTGSQVPCT
jgi:hypothetical protein